MKHLILAIVGMCFLTIPGYAHFCDKGDEYKRLTKEELEELKAEWLAKVKECEDADGFMVFGHCMVPAEWKGGDVNPHDRLEMGTHGMWKEHDWQSGYVLKKWKKEDK